MRGTTPEDPRKGAPSPSVLFVDGAVVEWSEGSVEGAPDEAVRARVEAEDETPEALARAADEARRTARASQLGRAGQSCVLALGARIARPRILEVPPLSADEARRVLHRKAANLLRLGSGQTLFSALPLAEAGGAREGGTREAEAASRGLAQSSRPGTRRWLVTAVARTFLATLVRELRARGVTIESIVIERRARLGRALAAGTAGCEVLLVVDVERDAVVLSLLDRGELVTQAVLPGDVRTTPATALAVAPEARRLASYWRKASRGRDLDEVIVLGLDGDRGARLAAGLSRALGSVPVREPLGRSAVDIAMDGTLERFEPRITPPEVGTPSGRFAVVGSLLLLLAVIGWVVRGAMRTELRERDAEVLALEREELELATVYAERERIERTKGRLRRSTELLAQIRTLGVPFDSIVELVLDASGSEVELRALDVRGQADVFEVTVEASTDADPERSCRAIERLASELESSDLLVGVELAPLEIGGARSDRVAGRLSFTLIARLEGIRPRALGGDSGGAPPGGERGP